MASLLVAIALWGGPSPAPGVDQLLEDARQAGRWSGELAASLTENDSGLDIEFYLETVDEKDQPLLLMGTAEAPQVIGLAPGTIDSSIPFYETAWFWTLTGVLVVGASVGTAVAVERMSAPSDSHLGAVKLD